MRPVERPFTREEWDALKVDDELRVDDFVRVPVGGRQAHLYPTPTAWDTYTLADPPDSPSHPASNRVCRPIAPDSDDAVE